MDHCPLLFFGANEIGSVHVYGKRKTHDRNGLSRSHLHHNGRRAVDRVYFVMTNQQVQPTAKHVPIVRIIFDSITYLIISISAWSSNLDRPPSPPRFEKESFIGESHIHVCRIIFYNEVADWHIFIVSSLPGQASCPSISGIFTDLCGKSKDHRTGSMVFQAVVKMVGCETHVWLTSTNALKLNRTNILTTTSP